MRKHSDRLNIRLPPEMESEFSNICNTLGQMKGNLYRALIQALIDLYNRNNGRIVLPLRLQGISEIKQTATCCQPQQKKKGTRKAG